MTEPTIEQLLEAHGRADPATQRQIAEMLLERVEGRREIWMKHHLALSTPLVALGHERALEAVRAANRDLLDTYGDHIDAAMRAILEFHQARALQDLGELEGNPMKLQAALAAAERSETLFRRAGDPVNAVHATTLAANVNQTLGGMTGDPSRLRRAVAGYEAALEVQTREAMPADWAGTQNNRAVALHRLGDLGGDAAALRAAVAGYDAALEVQTRAAMPAGWAMTQQNRANALVSLGVLAGDAAAMREAVEGYDAALEVRTRAAMPAAWAATQNNRANALQSLGALAGDAATMREAVEGYDAALEVRTRAAMPADWAATQNDRAGALQSLGDLAGDAAALREAVEGYDAALEVLTRAAMPADWAATQNNRAIALQRLGALAGDAAAMREAVEGFEAALEVRTHAAMPADWAMTQSSRANALQSLGDLAGDAAALRDAVEGYDAALEVRTRAAMPADWAMTQSSRANALQSLGDLAGDAAALREAVECYDAALEVRTRAAMPAAWATTQMNRAKALQRLGDLAGDAAALRDAVQSCEAALEVQTRAAMPAAWAATQVNRAGALQSLGDLAGDAAALREAVEGYDAALEVRTRAAMPAAWAATQNNRANALQSLGDLAGDAAALREAVEGFEAALEVRTRAAMPADWAATQNDRAIALQRLGDLAGDAAALREAVQGFEAAWEQLRTSDAEYSTLNLGAHISRRRLASGDLAAALTSIDPCLAVSDAAIADAARSAEGRLEAVHRVSDLHGMKTICLLRTGGADAVWEAALAAEAGRARLARDAMRADVPEDVAGPEALADAAPAGGALALPAVTAAGSVVFVIRRAGPPVVVDLPELTDEALRARFNGEDGWLAAQRRVQEAAHTGGFHRGAPAHAAWNAHLDAQAAWLHEALLGPVEAALVEAGLRPAAGGHPGDPVVLLPTGLMGLLPLGAARARPEDPAFCERWSLALAPSAAMLAACRRRADACAARPASFLGLYHPTRQMTGVNPRSVLKGAAAEVDFAEGYFAAMPADRRRLLRDEEATREAALEGASSVSHLQLSCHGAHDPIVPERSGLELYHVGPEGEPEYQRRDNARLMLSDLQRIRLEARLVIMSACESGVAGVRKAPDEFIGLPAGMLAAGAAAAIGTLWSVADDTAKVFTKLFLARHLHPDGSERQPPAEAFRDVQRFLCHATHADLEGITGAEAYQARKPAASATQLPPAAAPARRPFANPTDWAAFTYTGT